ncbi:MAG TPA: hypothetical protein VGE77_10580 [Nocardioides sp.]
MGQGSTGADARLQWLDLVEPTMRGALDLDHVVVLHETDGARRPLDVAHPDAPAAGDQLVLRRTCVDGSPVEVVLARDGRDFTPHERRIATGILEALELAGQDPAVPTPTPLVQGDVADALERCLHDLDDMVAAPLVDRLTTVANRFASRLDASGWWLGHRTGEWTLTTAASAVRRTGPAADALRRTVGAEEVTWADPRTSTALEGGSIVAWRGESPEIAAMMETWGGLATLVAGGGYDLDAHQWMVCLVGDETSPDLRQAQAALSAAVQVALGFPRAPRRTAARW